MSANYDHLTAAHRLRSLADLMQREPRLKAELEELGVDIGLLSQVAMTLADEFDGGSDRVDPELASVAVVTLNAAKQLYSVGKP